MAVELVGELNQLRRMLLTMAAGVEQRVAGAIRGLLDHDLKAAELVRRSDDEIDEMEVDIESEGLRILALLHPVACDLRFVYAAMRINNDLERIADVARSIAKRAISLHKSVVDSPMPPAIEPMARRARQMLNNALEALTDGNADLARQVRADDSRVDQLNREAIAWVQAELSAQVDHAPSTIDLLYIARQFERIGDLCTNIAEDVIFLAEGRNVRHTDKALKKVPDTSIAIEPVNVR